MPENKVFGQTQGGIIMTKAQLQKKANELRRSVVEMVYHGQTGHIGGDLSECDILTVLYYQIMNIDPKKPEEPDRDRFVLSKGHCVETYYAILADKGFIDKKELETFSKYKSRLIGHPNRAIPGIEVNTGALGHGLPLAAGMALAGKRQKKDYNVYCLMGDGELAEGSIWEAAMFAANYELDNLYAIVDRNHLQISGPTEDVMKLEPLDEKWRAFGFEVVCIDGNDMDEILGTFEKLSGVKGKPKLIIADTIKGKGVSYMENNVKWHHGSLTKEQYQLAMTELLEREAMLG